MWIRRGATGINRKLLQKMTISVLSAAKINLYLDVIRRMDDGFHEIETLFQPISLWDRLTISAIPRGIEVSGDDPAVPWNEDNLCYRSAKILFDTVDFDAGTRIKVQKEIPPGAGLGGGSSNAAATLVGLNYLFKFGLSTGELLELARKLGSDVPFFILGKPAIGRGRGDILEGVEGLEKGWVLIVKPAATISTNWAYQNLNLRLTRCRDKDKLNTLIEGLKDFPDRALETWNSFIEFIADRYPEVCELLTSLQDEGAILSSLSGSGSACFALFSEESRAKEVSRLFIGKGYYTKIARPVSQAIKLL